MAKLRIETTHSNPQSAELPRCGFAEGTTILTLDGALPVEFLTPGDRILTRDGVCRLKGFEMALVRRARMVRVAASVIGHGRPDAPVWLLPTQPILLRDWRAKALYGAEQVLVEVARLADGDLVREELAEEARIFTLRLDRAAVIYAGGLEIACEAVTAGV